MKKKIIAAILLPVLIVSLAACGGSGSGDASGGEAKEVNILTWQGYIPDQTIASFEEETGIKVNYSFFETNEEMLTKLEAAGGDYDIVVCSEYIIKIGLDKDVFQTLDKSKLTNWDNLNTDYLGKEWDPQDEYSVPYAVFIAGILYNPAKTNLTFDSFSDLADPSLVNSVVLVDAPQSIIGEALTAIGYDYSETDPAKIEEASEFLQKLKPNVLTFKTVAPEEFIVNGEAVAAYAPSSNCIYGKQADPSLEIAYPTNSANVYGIDSFLIPKKAPHPDNAHAFINYMLRPERIAATVREQNVEVANANVGEYIEDMLENGEVALIPDYAIEIDKHPQAMPTDIQALYDKIWTEFKQ
jgi:spermidine/putrescine transport system substrate-binding protein